MYIVLQFKDLQLSASTVRTVPQMGSGKRGLNLFFGRFREDRRDANLSFLMFIRGDAGDLALLSTVRHPRTRTEHQRVTMIRVCFIRSLTISQFGTNAVLGDASPPGSGGRKGDS